MKYLHLTLREPPEWRNPMHTFLMNHDEMHAAALLNWNTSADDLDIILFRIVGAEAPYTDALDDSAFVVDYETARIDDDSFFVYIEHETRDVDDQFREPFLERRVLAIPLSSTQRTVKPKSRSSAAAGTSRPPSTRSLPRSTSRSIRSASTARDCNRRNRC